MDEPQRFPASDDRSPDISLLSVVQPLTSDPRPSREDSKSSTQVRDKEPKVGRKVVLIIIAMVALSDLTLYQARGFFGPAVFFPLAAILLIIGTPRAELSLSRTLMGLLLIALACRLAWSGGVVQMITALWAFNGFSMAIHGVTPWLLESIVFLASTVPGGYECLRAVQIGWRQSVLEPVDRSEPAPIVNFLMPLISVLIFGTIFVFANPNLIASFSSILSNIVIRLQMWVSRFSPREIIFWCAIAWLTAGLLRPVGKQILDGLDTAPDDSSNAGECSGMYTPFRNTLLSLSMLFSGYLIFEFRTLWFRQFPEGFHYSGYAHQGAAWLTAALALATVVLSMMFRGRMLQHPSIASLRRLAWIWSGLNFLLAASAYNRILIYVDFNGMTRMRVIGFLGISCVVVGFLLVLRKIARAYNFHWLIRHQLMVPVFALCLYAIAPVDTLVHRYNVKQILTGHPQPSVQISEHPIDDYALPVLTPLLSCDDPVIKDGVRSILLVRLREMQATRIRNPHQSWTEKQWGADRAYTLLTNLSTTLESTTSPFDDQSARARFRNYALKWW